MALENCINFGQPESFTSYNLGIICDNFTKTFLDKNIRIYMTKYFPDK